MPTRESPSKWRFTVLSGAALALAVGAWIISPWHLNRGSAQTPAPDVPLPGDIARVGGLSLTEREFTQAWVKRRPSGDPQAAKRQLLDELIRRKLLLAEATRTGFDQRPDIQAAWREFLANRFADEQASARDALAPPTLEELQAQYHQHIPSFTVAERIHAAILFLSRSPGADAAKEQALLEKAAAIREQALTRAHTEPDFGKLALEYSEHRATRRRGGDIGWVTRTTGEWTQELRDALFALGAPGEISPIVRTPHGLYVAKLLERQSARPRPFDEVREQLDYEFKRRRHTEAEDSFYAQLRSRHPVIVDEDQLAAIPVASARPATGPPRIAAR